MQNVPTRPSWGLYVGSSCDVLLNDWKSGW
jgi:hypothetical protein